ncbi:hypothetical protein VC83_06468 [Pseudogymnoascus destructans]|uniref:Uncharacterized protein n=2 Tax=Pseudogymnoascus destructans TaxID=655981 RepID=L8FP92_PSED2|nr:uncharacterized protein VC83_06468 [Pseudogymnoascus destructans]ELR02283.1 hypothetical protein GMDG_05352 [Pseudogymnoascus destructans 20631-21]OAF58230.1 hypothetical protein VC83_06468 [Pseudogymnoascus destructans]
MDPDVTIAQIVPHENDLQHSVQTANMAEASQTVAPKATHGTFQLSKNDSTMSFAKITASLSNSDSSGNLAKVTTRPLQNSLAGSRKFTPVQSVFNDFATAHSSITSKNSRAKLSENNLAESSLLKTELILEHFEVKPVRLDTAFPNKPAIPPRAALKNVRNLSLEFGTLGGASESEKGVFSTRNYGKVFSPRLSIVKDCPRSDVESPAGSSSLLVHPPSTPNARVNVLAARPVRPTSSVYSVSSPSPGPKNLFQDLQSDVLPTQAAGNDVNFIPLSPIIDQSKYQPGLFHSTSETVIHNHNYGEIHGLDSNFGDDAGSYYGYDEDISFEGSNNGEDLVLFPDQTQTFEDKDQTSLSNPSTVSLSNSSPHSEAGTVLHHVEFAGVDDDDASIMSFYDDENTIESITLPDNIPTATRATHGCPMVCPSQESIKPAPLTPFRRGTNTSAPVMGNPSNIGLPRVPAPPGRVYLADSSPRVLGPSSSPYEDTHNLLGLSPNTPTKKKVGKQANSASPLKKGLCEDGEESMSPATHNYHERNISIELHGMADDGGNSEKAPSPKKGEVGFQTTPSSYKSVMRNLRSDQKRLSKIFSDGFYATRHSPSKKAWHRRNKDKAIKIPIRPIPGKDGSPRLSKHRTSGSSNFTGKEDDPNDWETVTDSIMLFSRDDEKEKIRPFVDAAFNEAGSSIANFSDHLGESSSGPILAALTLAQSEQVMRYHDRYNGDDGMHPGHVMETSSSTMLPRRRMHGTDGFPLNGFRTPKRGFGAVTSSLMPEDTLSSPLDNYSRSRQNGPVMKPQYKSRFNDDFQHDQSISTTMDMTLPGLGNFAGPSTPMHWVEGDNHLGVDLRGSPSNRGMNSPDSFMQIMIQANGGTMPQYMGDNDSEHRTLGSSIADTSTASDDDSFFVDLHGGPPVNENHPYGGLYAFNQDPNAKERTGITPGNSRARAPLVKGPPGAFYRKLQSKANSLLAKKVEETPTKMPYSPTKSLGRTLPGKTKVAYSPSRMLRPLSLVADSLGPINQIIPQPTGNENYVYKSPLAPVQSAEWMNLYSTADLNRINSSPHSAHSSPRFDYSSPRFDQSSPRPVDSPLSSAHSSPLIGEPLLRDPAWHVHEGPPRLSAWIHDNSSTATDTADRKAKISNVAVAVCMLLPPALLLLRVGWLDQFMIWYTKGDISHFGKTQKKVAGYLFAAYVCSATVVVIITVLIHTFHASSA